MLNKNVAYWADEDTWFINCYEIDDYRAFKGAERKIPREVIASPADIMKNYQNIMISGSDEVFIGDRHIDKKEIKN